MIDELDAALSALQKNLRSARLRHQPRPRSHPRLPRLPADRGSYWGRSDEAAARQHFKHCADALELLFVAAARPDGDTIRYRLPAVIDSFIQY